MIEQKKINHTLKIKIQNKTGKLSEIMKVVELFKKRNQYSKVLLVGRGFKKEM